jgi:hypothetical protein
MPNLAKIEKNTDTSHENLREFMLLNVTVETVDFLSRIQTEAEHLNSRA